MFAFLKAIVLGAVLSFVVSMGIGHAGSTGGLTHVRHFNIEGFGFYWSWVIFVVGAGLSFAILLMME
jgi:hypothetical protein